MRTLYLCGAANPEGIRLALQVNRDCGRWDQIVLLDDDPAKHGTSTLGIEVKGPFALLEHADASLDEVANLVARTTVKRQAARSSLDAYALPFTTLVSQDVDTYGAVLGTDIIAYPHAFIGPCVSLGDTSVVFMGAGVGHGSQLGRCCVVAPNAVVNARVRLGDGVYVGANATVLPEVNIGPWATVGAGSVVMRDVPAGTTVMGVPAKTVFTFEMKRRMRAFSALPDAIRRDLESQVRQTTPGPAPVDRHAV